MLIVLSLFNEFLVDLPFSFVAYISNICAVEHHWLAGWNEKRFKRLIQMRTQNEHFGHKLSQCQLQNE